MQPIEIGVWDSPLGRYVSLATLEGSRLHFSGGRAVIETPDAAALRRFLASIPGPFLAEQGRVGLEGCRLDGRRRSGTMRRVRGNATMPPTPLPEHVVSFAYERTYDTAQSDTLLPPSSSGRPWQNAAEG
ncbi:MAG TPA: hypothetical protein ENK57_12350 [Polyangiaceae bacterium]|nr:hypothetical protein [Polyangiaceae bacterium]